MTFRYSRSIGRSTAPCSIAPSPDDRRAHIALNEDVTGQSKSELCNRMLELAHSPSSTWQERNVGDGDAGDVAGSAAKPDNGRHDSFPSPRSRTERPLDDG